VGRDDELAEALVPLLTGGTDAIRRRAASRVFELDAVALREFAPQLRNAIRHPLDADTLEDMLVDLIDNPKAARLMAPALENVLESPNLASWHRIRVHTALARTKDDPDEHVKALVDMIRNAKEKAELRGVIYHFGFIGSKATIAIPVLVELIENRTLPGLAAFALGKIEFGYAEAVPALVELANDRMAGDFARSQAVRALTCYKNSLRRYHDEMAAWLTDYSTNVREAACDLMIDLRVQDEALIGELKSMLQSRRHRRCATKVLLCSGLPFEEKWAIVAKAWDGEDVPLGLILSTLNEMDPPCPEIAPILLGGLKVPSRPSPSAKSPYRRHGGQYSSPNWNEEIIKALGETGCQGEAVIEAFTQALDDRDPQIVSAAARSLGQIGRPAESALPKLRAIKAEFMEKCGRRKKPGWVYSPDLSEVIDKAIGEINGTETPH
jgi:hypothetical protein